MLVHLRSSTYTGGPISTISCDFLIMATGLRPNTAWLRGPHAGLPDACFDRRGRVHVDAKYRLRGAGDAGLNVFAFGDCCDSADEKSATVLPPIARFIADSVVWLVDHGATNGPLQPPVWVAGKRGSFASGHQAPSSTGGRLSVRSLGAGAKVSASDLAVPSSSSPSAAATAAAAHHERTPFCGDLYRSSVAQEELLWSQRVERAKRNFVARFARQVGYSLREVERLNNSDKMWT